jgi:hypothetical protein
VKTVDPFCRFPVFVAKLEIVGNVDPFYDEHGTLCLNLSPGFRLETTF